MIDVCDPVFVLYIREEHKFMMFENRVQVEC